MNGPARFKSARADGLEWQLLAAALEEQPEPGSAQRAAQRLGISPSLLAAAAATSVMSTTSTATAAAAGLAKGLPFGGLSLLGAAKAAIAGVGLGVGIAVSAASLQANREDTPASNFKPVAAIVSASQKAHDRASNRVSVPEVEPADVPFEIPAAAPQASTKTPVSDTTSLELPAPSAGVNVSVTGRFEDVEPELNGAVHQAPTEVPGLVASPSNGTVGVPAPSSAAVDPRLAREIASLDQARAFSARGEAAAALSELDRFRLTWGYTALALEAKLVQIDALVVLGRHAEAARLAEGLPWGSLSNSQRQRLSELVRRARQ